MDSGYAADVGNSLFFIFILILWAADDYRNMSVHVYLLLLGCLMGAAVTLTGNGYDGVRITDILPACLMLLGRLCGLHIGGADIIAATLGGVMCGYASTVRALGIAFLIFAIVRKKGEGAFLPFYLLGQIAAVIINK